MCSLSYVSIDSIVDCILKLGKGALMAKIDIKQAYRNILALFPGSPPPFLFFVGARGEPGNEARNIPVHPTDRYLLGVQWKGELYIDKVLPFGLRSAPIIFSAVADALQWIVQQRGVEFIFHYLDNYITVAPPASDLCATNLRAIKQACQDTGTPIECEGPSTVITFLGMELDTVASEIRLPADKLKRLKDLLKEWRGRKAGKKRDLLSLIGTLNHASKAVRQGRTFLRRLINLSMAVKHMDNFVRLNISARSDIQRWWGFAESWNGVSMLFRQDTENPQVIVTSDASGSWGCGAYCNGSWFQFRWPPGMEAIHIMVKELIPVVMAAAVWGHEWSGRSVCIQCDNAAVVAIVNSGTSRDQDAMHLMRCLAFIMAKFNFLLVASHIRGIENDLADALSRDNVHYFHSNYPQAKAAPTVIPQSLADLLICSCKARLDISHLDQAVEFYFQNSLAPSTQCTYASAKNRYSQFCSQYNFPVLPVSEHQLCQYVPFLAEAGLSHVSIKCYLSAIRHLQIAHSLPDPHISSMPKLEGVIKGIKSQQAKKQPVVRPRLPITPVIMQKMRAVWEKDSRNQDNMMLWVQCLSAFLALCVLGR